VSVHKRTTRKGTVSWEVRWSESGRGSRQRSRSFPTKRDAQVFEAEVRRMARLGVHAHGEASPERLEQWLETWFRSNRLIWAPSTCKVRASHLERWVVPYIGDVRLRDLGAGRLRVWRDEMLADGATPHTMLHVMKTLSSALGAAVDDEKIPSNPLRGVKRLPVAREPRKALSAEQAEQVRAEMDSQRDRVLWGLLYCAGLRTEEVLAVRWSDILGLSRAGGTIKVDRRFVDGYMLDGTKTGPGRDVPVIGPLAQDLMAWLEESSPVDADELVCASRVGTPTNLHNWRARIFGPAKREAKVPWAVPYTGRTTYISLQIHAGLSPVTVAALAGNSPEIIWAHYAREFERSKTTRQIDLEAAVRAARRTVARSGLRTVFAQDNVWEFPRHGGGTKLPA
jgi:integrase